MSPMPFLSEIVSGTAIPPGKRAYFQERLRNRLYDLVIDEFRKQQKTGLTQAALAARIGRRPEQVHRWLASPANLTFDTLSDLLLGIAAAELEIGVSPLVPAAIEPTGRYRSTTAMPSLMLEGSEAALIAGTTYTIQSETARTGRPTWQRKITDATLPQAA